MTDPFPWLLLAVGVVGWWGVRRAFRWLIPVGRVDPLSRAIVTAILTSTIGGGVAPLLGHTPREGAFYGLIEGLVAGPVASWLHDAYYRARYWLRRWWATVASRK